MMNLDKITPQLIEQIHESFASENETSDLRVSWERAYIVQELLRHPFLGQHVMSCYYEFAKLHGIAVSVEEGNDPESGEPQGRVDFVLDDQTKIAMFFVSLFVMGLQFGVRIGEMKQLESLGLGLVTEEGPKDGE